MVKNPILIVGAGIPGASLAIKLADAGFSVALLDRLKLSDIKPTRTETRTAALMGQSVQWLKQCDAFQVDNYTPMHGLQITDSTQEPVIPHLFHAKEIGQKTFGYNCDIATLREAMIKKASKHPKIRMYLGKTIDYIEWGHSFVTVKLSGQKKTIQTPLVIAADGRNSFIRKQACIDVEETPYKQQAITAILSHDNDHNHMSREYHYTGGPLTFVPLSDNQSSLVWIMDATDADSTLQKTKAEIAEDLQNLSHGDYTNIQITSALETTPLGSLKACQITAHRCALIAEAAHAISPIGAQGMNLSLRDAQALLDTIIQAHRNGLDIGHLSSLSKYNKQYITDITPRVFVINQFHQNVATDTTVAHKMRRSLLKAISNRPIIRRFFMRQGLANS